MIKIISKPLLVERLDDGRRILKRDLILEIDGKQVKIPNEFITDYSSWPRFLPGPSYDKIDIAGVVHDYCFRYGTLGKGGPKISYVESNRVWYRVARAGGKASCSWMWAWVGRIGLFLGGWTTWLSYRANDPK